MQLRFFQQFQVCLGLFHKLFLKPLLVWKWMSSWKKKRFLNQNWGSEWSQVKQMGKKQIQLFQSFEDGFKFILGNDFWNLFWMMSKTLFQDWKPFRPKKGVLFPEIGRLKCFYLLPACITRMCMRIRIFCFKKTHTQTKKFPLANLFVQIYVFFPSNN